MAAVASKNILRFGRQQASPVVGLFTVQKRNAHSAVVKDQHSNMAAFRRGKGGRSSFSGVVATVFGSTGYLGRGVVHRLAKTGSQVICPYRGDLYFTRELRLAGDLGQVLFVPYNIRDEDSIRRAMKYSNVVINCVGAFSETPNYSWDDVNYRGVARLAKIAKEVGIERFVHVSDMNASLEPESHFIPGGSKYLISKQKGENAVREAFPEATIVRPSSMFGEATRNQLYTYVIQMHGKEYRKVNLPMWHKGLRTTKIPVFKSDVLSGINSIVNDPKSAGKVYEFYGPKEYLHRTLVEWYAETQKVGNIQIRDHRSLSSMLSLKFMKSRQNIMKKRNWFPGLTIELMERDSLSDTIHPELPSLEDLGVTLTPLELMQWTLMKPNRMIAYSEDIQLEGLPTWYPKSRRVAKNPIRDIEYEDEFFGREQRKQFPPAL